MKTFNIKRLLITAASIVCLGASAIAGPATRPMYIMISGAMYQVTAFTGDVTLDNGCKICMDGTVVTPTGHKFKLREGEMLSSKGVKMSPTALHAHGG
jgi:hypothetical protein